jgi:hypothetical protein
MGYSPRILFDHGERQSELAMPRDMAKREPARCRVQASKQSARALTESMREKGVNVASILPFIRKAGAIFDDRVTKIMGEAFDSACKELHDTGQPTIVYEVIAKRIIEAAKNGERNPIRLRNAGLVALGFDRDDKEAS